MDADRLLESEAEKWIIDHHLSGEEFLSRFDFRVIDRERFSSTGEILYATCVEAGLRPPRDLLKALLASILAESRFFREAKCETFSTVKEICERGIDIKSVLPLLKRPRDLSEKIAVLKGLKRMDLYRSGDWVIALSRLGAYHSEATRTLAMIDTDLVAVGDDVDEEKTRCKVHLRVSTRFTKELDITAG